MSRSDYMKPRHKPDKIDNDHARGTLGPFLTYLSGYNPLRRYKYQRIITKEDIIPSDEWNEALQSTTQLKNKEKIEEFAVANCNL